MKKTLSAQSWQSSFKLFLHALPSNGKSNLLKTKVAWRSWLFSKLPLYLKILWKSYVGFIKNHVDICRLNNPKSPNIHVKASNLHLEFGLPPSEANNEARWDRTKFTRRSQCQETGDLLRQGREKCTGFQGWFAWKVSWKDSNCHMSTKIIKKLHQAPFTLYEPMWKMVKASYLHCIIILFYMSYLQMVNRTCSKPKCLKELAFRQHLPSGKGDVRCKRIATTQVTTSKTWTLRHEIEDMNSLKYFKN